MTVNVVVMPMIGEINREERLDSLRACHAIHERTVRKYDVTPQNMERYIGEAIRELLLSDRVAALSGRVHFIVSLEVRP